MKKLIMINSGTLVTLFISCAFFFPSRHKALRSSNQSNANIIGTWRCDDDTTWKIVFPDTNTCHQYFKDSLWESDRVIFSKTSPQCGIAVPTDGSSTYMQLINQSDTTDHTCYEINGIINSSLSITAVGHGGAIVFTKQ